MATNFCSSCGEELEPGSHFCMNCGHPIADQAGATGGSTGPTGFTPAAVGPPPVAGYGDLPTAAPASPPPSSKRWWLVALAGLVGLALVATVVVLATRPEPAGAEVFLASAEDPGPDPFTQSVAPMPPPTTTPTTTPVPTTAAPGQVPARNGSAPGLYGGTGNIATCNADQLVRFLAVNPVKAAAWVAALNTDPTLRWSGGRTVSVSQIDEYVSELTPVMLITDTRVTNHGYRNGRPTSFQAVLQAGTAVLVDRYGIPRVKCGCGNPLTVPLPVSGRIRYRGNPWPGWNPTRVIVVQQSVTIIRRFILVNTSGPGYIVRPAGTDGGKDTPSDTPSLPTTTTTTTTTTSTTTTTAPPTTLPPATVPPATYPPATSPPSGSPWCSDAVDWYTTAHPVLVEGAQGGTPSQGSVAAAIAATETASNSVPSQLLAELVLTVHEGLNEGDWTRGLDALHQARPEITNGCGVSLEE